MCVAGSGRGIPPGVSQGSTAIHDPGLNSLRSGLWTLQSALRAPSELLGWPGWTGAEAREAGVSVASSLLRKPHGTGMARPHLSHGCCVAL